MRQRGFTLIELLVVIAIIAILAAILFPVFARAREKARQSSCLSNVKQLSLGLLMYGQDYDERLPRFNWGERACGGNPASPGMVMWYASIMPYVKNVQLYECPSADGNNRKCANNAASCPWSTAVPVVHYGMNEVLSSNGQKFAQMQVPAETLMIGDCRSSLGGWNPNGVFWRFAFANDAAGLNCTCDTGPATPYPSAAARHNEGTNLGLADGHAKWYKWNNVSQPPLTYWP